MGVISNLSNGFRIDTYRKFLHFVVIQIWNTEGEYLRNSVVVRFTRTGYIRGGWVPEIKKLYGNADYRVAEELQGGVVNRVMLTYRFGP